MDENYGKLDLPESTYPDLAEMSRKVDEIHEFCKNLAEALKGLEQNPMLRTMLGL